MDLTIKDLKKNFEKHEVLKGINYTFEKGKIYTILGRNGSGKTTLFNCISQEIPFEEGQILLSDGNVVLNSDVGLVYTEPFLPDFMTGYEFMLFFADIHKDKGIERDLVNEYLDSININNESRHRLIKDYSSGMKNKLQMLCVILTKPKVLLLDEPLTSFDLVASMEMKKILLEIKKDCVMIVSTHILQIARDLSDEILVLNKGLLTETKMRDFNNADFEEELMELLKDE